MSGSVVRRPRVRLIINGTPVSGCRSTEIVSRRGSQAASFHVHASFNEISRTLGQDWIDQDTLNVEIDFGFLPLGAAEGSLSWTRMIAGGIDRVGLDQVTGLVSIEGRDLASRLIDLPVQDAYLNRTSSELATTMAQGCGLTADVDATSGLVGQYYQIQHTKAAFGAFSRHANGWDLLAELASIEGYDLWVEGTTLYFKQASDQAGDAFDITYVAPEAGSASPTLSISDLTMERMVGLSGPVRVTVASWNSRQRRQVTSVFPQGTDATAKQFTVLKPNLLADQADALAKTTYSQLRVHQRVIRGVMAGELQLTTRNRVRLVGTGTGWDGVYTLDQIERQMSLEKGFIEHITARCDPGGAAGNG